MEKIIIEFLQKDLYQPRKDFNRETWFALSNTILENPDFYHLNPLEFKALIYLYCQASKNKWKATTIVYGHAKKFSDIEYETMLAVIALLVSQQKLKIIENVSVQKENVTVQEDQSLCTLKKERKNLKKEHKELKEGEEPSAPAKNDFEILDELKGYESLEQVLCSISTKLQKQWLDRYKNPEWVKENLSNAVDWHLTKANDEPVTEWPQKLISWLARQKDKPTSGQTADPYSFLNDEEIA